MKPEDLFEAIGQADENLLARSEKKALSDNWPRRLAAAACIGLAVLGGGYGLIQIGGFYLGHMGSSGDSAPMEAAEPGGDGPVFDAYAGPVLPLTLEAENENITAERELTYDFSPYITGEGEYVVGGAAVTDSYTLTNTAQEDQMVTALYPVAAALGDLAEDKGTIPSLWVNGVETEGTLYAADNGGGYQIPDWESYKELLTDPDYLAEALTEPDPLEQQAVVYEFSDVTAPEEAFELYSSVNLETAFRLEEASYLTTYNFNGMDTEEGTGQRWYSFFIQEREMVNQLSNPMVVVFNGDAEDYTVRGYGYKDGKKTVIDGVTAQVTRRELTLGELYRELIEDCCALHEWQTGTDWSDVRLKGLLYQGVSEVMQTYGDDLKEAFAYFYEGMNSVIDYVMVSQRVVYVAVPVTVPAGESVTLTIQQQKEPSYNFYRAHSGDEPSGEGYDALTTTGSNLTFTGQTAAITAGSGVNLTILQDNFGFDLENGVNTVALDLDQEHYYLVLKASCS